MKFITKFLTALTVVTLFVSCQKDSENLIDPTLKRVMISPTITDAMHSSAIATRASELSFDQGDRIGVTIIKEDQSKHAENALMTYTEGIFSGNIAWYEGSDASTMIAYYPYSSAEVPTTFSVVADQTTGYDASDLMGAVKSEVAPTEDAINMTFKHLMSKIIVNIKQTDISISSVVLKNAIPTGTIDFENQTVTVDQTATATDITAQIVTTNANYRAIIVPQTVALTIAVTTTQGETLTKNLSSATIISGGQYSVNIEIESGQLKVSLSGDIENWTNEGEIGAEPQIDFTNGMFLLNEGNMTTENGFLIYIDRNGVIHNNIYKEINGTSLGKVSQDLYIRNGKMYILAQNGGNETDGKLVIANATTLLKEQGIQDIPTISSPSHIAVTSGNTIYLRGNNGVYRFDPQGNTTTKLLNSGAKNRMVAIDDKVFSYNGKVISVLKDGADAVVETIDMGQNIIGITPSADGNIWAASASAIFKINPTAYTFVEHSISETTIGSISAAPSISAIGNRIYFRNSTKVWCHDFDTNTTVQKGDVLSYLNYEGTAGTFYNGFGVHPVTEEVCYTSIKGFGLNYLINYIGIFDFSDTASPMKHKFDDYIHFPAGVYYPEAFK